MKKEFLNKLTGEVIEGNDLMGFIDEDKLSKNTEFYGYYQLVSSELELSEEETKIAWICLNFSTNSKNDWCSRTSLS